MRTPGRLVLHLAAVVLIVAACSGNDGTREAGSTAPTNGSSVSTTEPEVDVTVQPPPLGPSAADLAAGAWATQEAPPAALGDPSAVQAAPIGVLAYGTDPTARQPIGSSVANAARLDTTTGTWVPLAQPPGPARGSAASVWTDGTWLLLGGHSIDGDPFDDGLAWDAATDTWRPVPAAPFSPWDAVADPSGVHATDSTGTAVAVLDPDTLTWESLPPPPPLPGTIGYLAGIVVHDDELHLFRSFEPDDPTGGPVTEGHRLTDTGWVSLGPARSPTATDIVSTRHGIIGSEGPYCRAAWGCPARGAAVAVTLGDDGGWVPHTDERTGEGRAIWTRRVLVFSTAGHSDGDGPVGPPAWDPATDTWTTLPRPPGQYGHLLAQGDRIIALAPDATYVLSPPLTATSGSDGSTIVVELTHTGPLAEIRGACWVLERWDPTAGWADAAHVVEDELVVGAPIDPYPVDADPPQECPAIGLTGPGPDRVRIPADAVAPGLHRLCHGTEPGTGACTLVELPGPT